MWTFIQTGALIGPDGKLNPAYSGRGQYKNDPHAQNIENWGPIPCGIYRIGDPVDTVTHGPYVLPLAADAANEMFGRSGFLIHGDSIVEPGSASDGCIIVSRALREQIVSSMDRGLQVKSGVAIAVDPGTEAE